ncbi:MAG TPA: class A beta-lactamase [Chthoniobacterales bacterium]|nr:class A beta-lactamase [Chthoniobacterales bacterium]
MRWFALLGPLCVFALSTSAAEPQVESRIAQIETETGSRIGVVAIDSATNRRIEHRPNERFLMCSTFKLLAAAAILQRVDRGTDKLDQFVRYTQADILEYAPVTKQHVAEGGMKLGALCEAAIEQSDNTAGNLLLQAINGPVGLTKFARSLGDETTRLDRMEPELNIAKEGDERDTTSPAAMCNDLVRLFTSDFLSEESRELLQGWLLHNQTGATLIRSGVPKGWAVGDKTGRSGSGETNDVAILYSPVPDGPRIFVAIYVTAPSLSDEKRSEILANVTREIVAALPTPAKN